ncbi:SpdD protein [Streptomyces sp. NPDC056154]|uniref:SpdD protein n=1 Tax=unclassified Streptomyces TaxID=2593676 RepID=UPI0035DE4C92
MLNPKHPTPDTASAPHASLVQPLPGLVHPPVCDCTRVPAAPAPPPAPASRPGVRITPGALIATVAGGTTAALVVGAVLVSMLLAVAVTAVSVALCALVLRSLLNDTKKGR